MAHVCFVVFYDDAALGLVTMGNALIERGHQVTNVHFKLPSARPIPHHAARPRNIEFINCGGILHGTSLDVDPWTDAEEALVSDLLVQLKPDLVGFSTRSNYNGEVIEFVRRLRARFPGVPLLAGGFGPTYDPAAFLEVCDYVCLGEGEDAIVECADRLDAGRDCSSVVSLARKHNGEIVTNPLMPPVSRPGLFYPDDRIATWVVDENEVRPAQSLRIRDSEFYTLVGRGCEKGCVYCSAGQWYRLYRDRGITMPIRRNRNVGDIMASLRPAVGHFPRVHFLDDFLFGPLDYMKEFFREYKRTIGLPFVAQISYVQFLNHPEMMEIACDAGLVQTVVGVQSTSQTVRSQVFRRKETDDMIVAFTEMLDRFGVTKDFHIISHNPFESDDDIERGYGLLARLSSKNANVDFMRLQVLRGSPLEHEWDSHPRYERDLETNRRIVYKQLARLMGTDRDFEEVSTAVDDPRFAGIETLAPRYPGVFRPYQTGLGNVLMAHSS